MTTPDSRARGPDDHSLDHIDEEVLAHDDRPPVNTEQLVQQLRETADKLLRDGAARGDVKLLNTAMKELRYAFKVLAPFRHMRKVSMFGSARLPSTDPAFAAAEEFGRLAAAANWMVITGAASGIMEAGHIGAGRDKSIGFNILLPFEQEANAIIRGDVKLMHLKYFFTRKLLFVKESDAVALFPGGFGTQDEGFEVLTLVQTGKSQLIPLVMVDAPGGDYWLHWNKFITDVLLPRGLISPADLALFKVTDSVQEAMGEILAFYRVYHSMRYVAGDLLLRLKYAPSAALLEQIRSEFHDIAAGGTFELTKALPAEANDVALRDLPRLRFRFDRKSIGRLRMLVDLINRKGGPY
jgi:uncharacterized protein (TIGR00730 family)